MAASHHQGKLVESKAEGGLDVTATVSDDGDCVILHIVNLSDKGIPVEAIIKGFDKPTSIKEISLSGDLKEVNSPSDPEKISPIERKIDNLGAIFAKPYSYTLVEVHK